MHVKIDRSDGLGKTVRPKSKLFTYKRLWLVLLIPFSVALTAIASRAPGVVERVYANGVYRVLSGVFGRLFSLLPFSLVEWVIAVGVLGILFWLVRGIVRLVRRGDKGARAHRMLADACCVAGVGYFLFVLLCGFNYYRPTFAEQSGLHIRDSAPSELALLYTELAGEVNELATQVTRDKNGVMQADAASAYTLAREAPGVMAGLAELYPQFSGFTPRPKPLVFSRVMSRFNLSGIYIPFTFEANVNADLVGYNTPFNMMHELAHFKGFMREDEANFIAYLACRESSRTDFRYSGTMLALIHCGNALYSADVELYREVAALLSDEVRIDLIANSAYWKQFEGPVAEVAERVNDAYLKTNRQVDGVKSYGRMVDLLLADYRDRHGLD